MATLGHPPIPADPLWSATLARYETHQGHYVDIRSRLQHPPRDRHEHQFRSQFHAIYWREPTPGDVPTWHQILLTEEITVSRPLTQEEYLQAARSHMFRPIINMASNETVDYGPTHPQGPTTPAACTPMSSPPRSTAPPPPTTATVQAQPPLNASAYQPQPDRQAASPPIGR